MNAPFAQNSIFDRVWAMTADIEGRDTLSLDPQDPGNWTGGEIGHGVLRGTRWGFSAASYPDLDIEHLTEDHATGLAFARVWLPVKCGSMPAWLACQMFDAAFQHGNAGTVQMLQRALGQTDDGDFGPKTTAALEAALPGATPDGDGPLNDFQVQRLLHMSAQPSWARIGKALSRRIVRVTAFSMRLFAS